MMFFDPYMAQRLAEEYMKERRREAEQYRLIRAAQGPRKARGWWTPAALMFGSLVGLVLQPQNQAGF
jgi:hypothetical protein